MEYADPSRAVGGGREDEDGGIRRKRDSWWRARLIGLTINTYMLCSSWFFLLPSSPTVLSPLPCASGNTYLFDRFAIVSRSQEAADRGGRRHGATTTVAQIKSMVMGSWPGSESGISDSDGSWKPRELPEEEGDGVGWWPRKRVTMRGWKRVCLWSSPSETMRLGDLDFSPSSPQRHALLLLLAGI